LLTNQILPSPNVLKGEVCSQLIRCSKPGCRCQEGQLHGPYYYRVWREAGRVKKIYIRSSELNAVREACEHYQTYFQRLRDLRKQREELTRGIQSHWRKTQKFLRSS
jgi:hypothetical protein